MCGLLATQGFSRPSVVRPDGLDAVLASRPPVSPFARPEQICSTGVSRLLQRHTRSRGRPPGGSRPRSARCSGRPVAGLPASQWPVRVGGDAPPTPRRFRTRRGWGHVREPAGIHHDRGHRQHCTWQSGTVRGFQPWSLAVDAVGVFTTPSLFVDWAAEQ